MKIPVLLCLISLSLSSAFAGIKTTPTPVRVAPEACGPFEKGGHELNFTGGFFYSPVIATGNRPVLNYVQGDASLGWMLTSPSVPCGHECLRGNWEALANLFGAGVVRGPDGFWGGMRALLRYNFVQPDSKWVPFFQIGAGGLGDNVYRHRDQRVIGSGFEFTLVADGGIRYFMTPKCAALVMIDFEHISNAGTAARNLGVNAVGGTAGVAIFF